MSPTTDLTDLRSRARAELHTLLRHWRPALTHVVLVTVAGLAYALLATPQYVARALVRPSDGAAVSGARGLAALVPGALAAEPTLPGPLTPDLVSSLLRSRRIVDPIIVEHGLVSHYRADNADGAYLTLLDRLQSDVNPYDDLVRIRLRDRDPELAASIVNGMVNELDAFLTEVAADRARRQREFLDARLVAVGEVLDHVEADWATLQAASGLPGTPRSTGDAWTALSAIRLELEVELEAMARTLAPDSDPIRRRRSQLAAIDAVLSSQPEPVAESERMYRGVVVARALHEYLTTRRADAVLAEAGRSRPLQIVDAAAVPERRALPRRTQVVLCAFAIAVVFAVAIARTLAFFERDGGGILAVAATLSPSRTRDRPS